MSVFCLGPEQIDDLWSEIGPHLYRLERAGYGDAEEIREDLKAERKQLFGYEEGGKIVGVCVTRITKTGICEIYAAVGTQSARGQIQETHDAIERWAKSIGCIRLRLQGRRGWPRVLKGYVQVGVIVEKEI